MRAWCRARGIVGAHVLQRGAVRRAGFAASAVRGFGARVCVRQGFDSPHRADASGQGEGGCGQRDVACALGQRHDDDKAPKRFAQQARRKGKRVTDQGNP